MRALILSLLTVGSWLGALVSPTTVWAEPPTPTEGRAEAGPEVFAGELRLPRFRVRYTDRAETAARALAEELESARDAFREQLGVDWPGVTEVRVGFDRRELDQLALPGTRPPSWAIALAYPSANVVLLDAHALSTPQGQTTLRHELSHVALGQLAERWPRWFQEGLAVHLTGEQRYALSSYSALSRAVAQGGIFELDDLDEAWPDHPTDVELAYAQSASFVDFLMRRHGAGAFRALMDAARGGDPFQTAFAKAFHTTLELEEHAWRDELPRRYSWTSVLIDPSLLWALCALLCVAGFLRFRALRNQRLAVLAAQEAAEDAAERIARAEVLQLLAEGHRADKDENDDEDESGEHNFRLH